MCNGVRMSLLLKQASLSLGMLQTKRQASTKSKVTCVEKSQTLQTPAYTCMARLTVQIQVHRVQGSHTGVSSTV